MNKEDLDVCAVVATNEVIEHLEKLGFDNVDSVDYRCRAIYIVSNYFEPLEGAQQLDSVNFILPSDVLSVPLPTPEENKFNWKMMDTLKPRTRNKRDKLFHFNNILFRLADYYNPEGWEWDGKESYYFVVVNHGVLCGETWRLIDSMTPKFHPYAIHDALDELMAHRERWYHLVFDSEFENEK